MQAAAHGKEEGKGDEEADALDGEEDLNVAVVVQVHYFGCCFPQLDKIDLRCRNLNVPHLARLTEECVQRKSP